MWAPSPGPRFYVNILLIGGVLAYGVYAAVRSSKRREKGERGSVGCLSFFLLFLGFLLYLNARDFIWPESYSINEERIQHSYYTNVWKTSKVKDSLRWADISLIDYSPETNLESTTWVQVDPVTRERIGQGRWEEGVRGRALFFSGGGDHMKLVLEKERYGSPIGDALDFILGDDDYKISSESEEALKAALNKVVPKSAMEKSSPAARAYFAGEVATTNAPRN